MRPAFSIIFFTVMSGFGFGLGALVALNLIEMPEMSDKIWVLATIFIFAGAGLLSSTFHLGHPERAWRALTQWRSSWLSREGVLAIITLDAILGWFLLLILLARRLYGQVSPCQLYVWQPSFAQR